MSTTASSLLFALKMMPWQKLNDHARALLTPTIAKKVLFSAVSCSKAAHTAGLGHPLYPTSPIGDEYPCDQEARRSIAARIFGRPSSKSVGSAIAAPDRGDCLLVAGSPRSSPAHATACSGSEVGMIRISRQGHEDVVLRSNLAFEVEPGTEVTSWMPTRRFAEKWCESRQCVVARVRGDVYTPECNANGSLKVDYAVVRVVQLPFGGTIVFFAGSHLAGTRATGDLQWLSGKGLAACLTAQRRSSTGSWEALLRVRDIAHDAASGSRGREISVVRAYPLESSPTSALAAA